MLPRLTKFASSTGSVGASRSNSAVPSPSAGPPVLSRSANLSVLCLELTGDRVHPLRPGRDRIRRPHLRAGHRRELVDQPGERVAGLAGVDRQRGATVDEPGQFRPQTRDGFGGFIDDGVQIVLRDRLRAPCWLRPAEIRCRRGPESCRPRSRRRRAVSGRCPARCRNAVSTRGTARRWPSGCAPRLSRPKESRCRSSAKERR
jgi:hypothetical protein